MSTDKPNTVGPRTGLTEAECLAYLRACGLEASKVDVEPRVMSEAEYRALRENERLHEDDGA